MHTPITGIFMFLIVKAQWLGEKYKYTLLDEPADSLSNCRDISFKYIFFVWKHSLLILAFCEGLSFKCL